MCGVALSGKLTGGEGWLRRRSCTLSGAWFRDVGWFLVIGGVDMKVGG